MGGAGARAGTVAVKAEKDTPPQAVERGKGPGARVFRGPVRPVTNSSWWSVRTTLDYMSWSS